MNEEPRPSFTSPNETGRATLPAGSSGRAPATGHAAMDETLLATGTDQGGGDDLHMAPTLHAGDSLPPGGPAEDHANMETVQAGSGAPPVAVEGGSVTEVGAGATRMTILPRAKVENGVVTWIHTRKDRLEVLHQLGEGGAGEVLVAMDHDIGRKVAVKKIRSTVKSPAMVMRFIEEIRTVGRLEHPNIIPIHDVGMDGNGDYYFVMKYVEGETLEEIIARLRKGDRATHETYPFERRMQVFRGILEALHYAHSQRIIHRDIKPANVMVGPFGEVLLMDWGIAREIDGGEYVADTLLPGDETTEADGDDRFWKTSAGSLIGTPAYMSPEQARGEPLDERSDTYALSVLLYEFLGTHHYLDGKRSLAEILAGVQDERPGVFSMSKGKGQGPVPMDIVWFVRKGMHKEADKRFQSVAEMLSWLDLRAQGIIPISCHITFMKRVSGGFLRFMDRNPELTTLGMVATLGLAVYGIVQALI